MSDLPREILDDLNTQRFQENVAKKIKKSQIQQDLNNLNFTNGLSALALDVQNLQSEIAAIPSSVYEDHSFSISAGGSAIISHGLGVVPSGWVILDKNMGPGGLAFDISRNFWNSSQIQFLQYDFGTGATCNYKIRVYK